ncbi:MULTISPECIES: LTA synthase family protein [Priestia]|uniref:Sulfatase-like hydrolase/transferase n=2 Tax=Priestia megaterium TaxID=1404 RepID=A0A6M6DMP0_PRIMG|nr:MULTISPECIES: LTA synthase family protein [Priestia]MBU8753298.1 LTA synthase family protein [Priestia megaterium]MBY0196568.1 LTA synthase family protein [Priestia megaterium]MCU7707821.1 LTA synthase family protein [Priestia megaterium]MCW1047445.1 LTA synthase family protein [Priestia sp. JV24]MDH3185459.1 LTA synthase family protein [Priestia megaterium]
MKKLFSKPLFYFFIAVLFMWIKSYMSYKVEFNLDISDSMQKTLLFINPISSTLIFLGLALFAKGKRAIVWTLILSTIMTVILYSNILYYRFFNDFVTLPTLTQTSNVGHLGGSIADLVKAHDIFYFVDIILLIALLFVRKIEWPKARLKFRYTFMVLAAGAIAFAINLHYAEKDRPELLTRTFDRNYLVKYLGAYNYTVYDAVQTFKNSKQRAFASSDDLTTVKNFSTSHYAAPNIEYAGKAKGKNIIKIHLESFQSFLINYKLNGQEVTPFLNSLANGNEFMYFDNFFHQTGQGKTADAELMMDTSLYGLPQGSAFSLKGRNTYQAAPAILDQEGGYTSAVLHGDYKTFWNRNEIYKQFGVDKFFDASYYNMTGDNKVNYGLKDKPFFKESMPMLQSLKQPFYAHMITLTNHFPFVLDKGDASIEPANTGDGTVDRYFQTARYLDESLQEFFTELKASGLYDNSVIMIYGDHYGISENHNKAMEKVLGEKITPYKNAQLQRVPFFLHVPGVKGGVNHTYGGEIDVVPTLLHLVGIDSKEYVQFGTDLLSKDHDQVVAFRNGDYVSPKYTSIDGKYYDTNTGERITATDEAKAYKKKVGRELELSDKVLYGDLLRFNKLDDFKAVDPSKYMYGKDQETEK